MITETIPATYSNWHIKLLSWVRNSEKKPKKIYVTFEYEDEIVSNSKNRITENWFTSEFEDELLMNINDPKNTSYWPISIDDFISEMKKW